MPKPYQQSATLTTGSPKRRLQRVVVTDVSFEENSLNTDNHLLPVIISYRVIRTQVEGNLVYLFLRENH